MKLKIKIVFRIFLQILRFPKIRKYHSKVQIGLQALKTNSWVLVLACY